MRLIVKVACIFLVDLMFSYTVLEFRELPESN